MWFIFLSLFAPNAGADLGLAPPIRAGMTQNQVEAILKEVPAISAGFGPPTARSITLYPNSRLTVMYDERGRVEEVCRTGK